MKNYWTDRRKQKEAEEKKKRLIITGAVPKAFLDALKKIRDQKNTKP